MSVRSRVASTLRAALCVVVGASATAACGDAGQPVVARTRAGDTTVVQYRGTPDGLAATLRLTATFGAAEGGDTVALGRIAALAVGATGRVYALDAALPAIRVFDATLNAVAIWSRSGSGPGELRSTDGGLAVLADGRVAVRDPGNARLTLLDSTGRHAASYGVISAGLRTRDNFGRSGDTLLSRVVVDATGPIDEWQYGLARISPAGTIIDTVRAPTPTLPKLALVARARGNTAELPLPFAPRAHGVWHPAGGFAVARGDRYAVTWPSARGLVRVERDLPPVPVSSAEREQERDYVTKGLRWLDPGWQWSGPDVPERKPLVGGLLVGDDGAVWVLREGAAVEQDDPDFRPNDPSSVERRLRSALLADVFTADGDLIGQVTLPSGLRTLPTPVVSARGLVALLVDAEGVPRLTRFVLERDAAP